MKTSTEHASEVESGFLAGVKANLAPAREKLLGGRKFEEQEFDSADRVRAAMIDRRIFDRDKFARMPHGKRIVLRGYDRRFLFGRKYKSVTIASVLAPPDSLLDSEKPAGPVTMGDLTSHVRDLLTGMKAPHLIGVCSPSGFSEEIWRNPPQFEGVRLVLVEPRDNGGWRISEPQGAQDARLCKLFDPEQTGQKLSRVKREIEEARTDLLTGSLSAATLARRLEVPVQLVEQAFQQVCKADPELRVSKKSGEILLYRGAAKVGGEVGSMSLSEKIWGLFSREGDEARKINALSERRAALTGKLDRLYEDISRLEKREDQILAEGKAAASDVTKRRIAGQVSRLRKDISRVNTTAAILSKQINIISTHIHNLELAQTGNVAKLPSSEELTEAAVSAEEILEQLSASDELVSGLEVSMAETSISDDEAAILRELQGDAKVNSPLVQNEPDDEKTPLPERSRRERGPAQAEG